MIDHTLYADSTQRKFYWVPNDAKLPEGDFQIMDLRRRTKMTSASAAEAYRISEKQAKEIAREAMASVSQQATNFVSKTAKAVHDLQQSGFVPSAQSTNNAADRLAASIGLTQEQLRTDPEAVKAGITSMLSGLSATIAGAAKEEAERSPQIKVALEAMKVAAQEEFGSQLGNKAGEWPERVVEALRNPELEKGVRDATEKLKEMAAELRRDKPSHE